MTGVQTCALPIFGHTPNTALADELFQAGYDVRIIGDAVKVGLVGPAVRAGYLTARQI